MMKKLFTLILLGAALGANAQNVGINTNSPKATLDVVGAPATPGTPDGIIPPKLTRAQLIAKTGYGANQIGAIVYVTTIDGTVNTATANIIQAGYYIFDGAQWNTLMPKLIGFHAYKTDTYSIGATSSATIIFNNKEHDANNWYSTSTGRFTPKVEGYYQVNAAMRMYDANTGERNIGLFKNGTTVLGGSAMTGTGARSVIHVLSGLVYLNGSTDYITVSVYTEIALTSSTSKQQAYFQAYLVGQ